VTLGLVPAIISPYVVRKIGWSAARELCLTGARFSAARARAVGLVHEVVAENELDAAVDAYAAQFMTTVPSAVARMKLLLREIHGRSPADVNALTVDAIATQRVSREGQDAMAAFLRKRRGIG
jgi:methylglutaconyl-CoA hydratase